MTSYRYQGCGLEEIYLLNGYALEQHDGETHISIQDLDGLHRAIARHLIDHKASLTPREIRFLRNTFDLTQADVAAMLGASSQSVARWEKGHCEMPLSAEKLLRAFYLAQLIGSEELQSLRTLLLTPREAPQASAQISSVVAEFSLGERWEEQRAA